MSWTFTLGLCSTASPETLKDRCVHDPENAANIIHTLGLVAASETESLLDDAFGMPPQHIAVGSYKDIVLISDPSYLMGPTSDSLNMRIRAVPLIPNARVLCAQTAGIVGYSSYAYWVDGALVRRFRADPDNGVTNIGDFVPVESDVIVDVCTDDSGVKFVVHRSGGHEVASAHDCGTELTFAMMSMFFGVSYEMWRGDSPCVSVFKIRGRNEHWRDPDVYSSDGIW